VKSYYSYLKEMAHLYSAMLYNAMLYNVKFNQNGFRVL
jgi:hypothetical protein